MHIVIDFCNSTNKLNVFKIHNNHVCLSSINPVCFNVIYFILTEYHLFHSETYFKHVHYFLTEWNAYMYMKIFVEQVCAKCKKYI